LRDWTIAISMVNDTAADVLLFPALSVAMARAWYRPLESGDVKVKLNGPLVKRAPALIHVAPLLALYWSCTLANPLPPVSLAFPERVGRLLLVRLLFAGAVMVTAGAVWSMV